MAHYCAVLFLLCYFFYEEVAETCGTVVRGQWVILYVGSLVVITDDRSVKVTVTVNWNKTAANNSAFLQNKLKIGMVILVYIYSWVWNWLKFLLLKLLCDIQL